jgi:hypothetical protein
MHDGPVTCAAVLKARSFPTTNMQYFEKLPSKTPLHRMDNCMGHPSVAFVLLVSSCRELHGSFRMGLDVDEEPSD